MANKELRFEYNDTLLYFEIDENDKIYLLYAGKSKDLSSIDKEILNIRRFVEVEIAEDNRSNTFGFKSTSSSYGLTHKYVRHYLNKNNKGQELVILTNNEYLEVETHFQFYDGVSGFSCFNLVKNINKNNVTLTYVSSFFVAGLYKANLKDMYLYQPRNSWHCEAQWIKDSFIHLGIFNGNDYLSNKRHLISNTGSWSTKDYLPMMVIENETLKEDTLIQIENSGSWNLEIGDIGNHLYFAAFGPCFNNNAWKKVLKPNEVFTSCSATVTYGDSFEKVIQEVTLVRRKNRRIHKDNIEMPIIFNDYMHALWDTQTTDLIKPLVDVASDVGCEVFCMDAGWFAPGSDWWNAVGVWEEYKENFPNGGLKAVCDYIRDKGMVAGLWIEPEAVGLKSPMIDKLEDGSFFKANGHDVIVRERKTLNFANPKVYTYMIDVVSKLVTEYGLGYIKTDYNTDAGVGNEYDSDSLGDGLLKQNRAYIKWLNEIMDKFPGLTIENCASGGCRMDSEILKYCPIQSTSDQTNYKKYPYLSTNVLTAVTPEQAAVWSYPVDAYVEGYMPSDEAVAMNLCNAMLGRIHLASYINKLPTNQLDLIREGLRFYNEIKPIKGKSVPIYPKGISFFFDEEVIGGIQSEDKIVLGVWNTSGKQRIVEVDLSKYNVVDVKVGYPLSLETKYCFDQKTKKLSVAFDVPYGARMFVLNRKKESL